MLSLLSQLSFAIKINIKKKFFIPYTVRKFFQKKLLSLIVLLKREPYDLQTYLTYFSLQGKLIEVKYLILSRRNNILISRGLLYSLNREIKKQYYVALYYLNFMKSHPEVLEYIFLDAVMHNNLKLVEFLKSHVSKNIKRIALEEAQEEHISQNMINLLQTDDIYL